jgi:Uma2 family endonuclease
MTTSASAETDDLYEIVDGKRIQLNNSPLGAWIVSKFAFPLANFVQAHQLGWTISHALFHLPAPINRDRRPDIAFVSYERWARNRPLSLTDDAWDVIPNLTTEVVSPSDTVQELQQKIHEYFRAGVELVWVVYPVHSKIHVYQSPTQITVLSRGDVLDGGTVVPGFKLPLMVLFPEYSQSAPTNGGATTK